MTEFQRLCQRSTEEFLQKSGVPVRFELKNEAGDPFLVTRFSYGDHDFEVFIYEDEAGFFVDRVWHIQERQDFDTPQQLIAGFLLELTGVMADRGTSKRRRNNRWGDY